LSKNEEADLKVHIVKINDVWEVGLQITPRPLSFRSYKVKNMSGAMDPTIAYSLNSLCNLEQASTYLNIFSGSATLLIEAGQCYSNLDKLIGFDIDKERLSLSIQNIKKAGLIKKVQIKEADIFSHPDFGKFDVIVSDLPFGMVISKDEDLEKLYKTFIAYTEEHLSPNGRVAVYTSEFETFEKIVLNSKFNIIQTLNIQLITSEDQYLPTKILVLTLK
jgi:23S rRNA G2445 N2-methylase RlmL